MKYVWEDLPKPLNCFTIRSASMINLNTGQIVRNYAANTKIVVVQKCVIPEGTYYRTSEAENHYLNYAFEASAFGLPNEKAPSAHSPSSKQVKKQKVIQKKVSPKSGEGASHKPFWKGLFRRKNG